MFTLQRLKLPPSLYKCLATTNVIGSPQSGVARRTSHFLSALERLPAYLHRHGSVGCVPLDFRGFLRLVGLHGAWQLFGCVETRRVRRSRMMQGTAAREPTQCQDQHS